MYKEIKKELQKYSSNERKKTNEGFFKTGKGEYGEGDIFIGVRVPDLRKIAKQFSAIDLKILEKFLQSKIHEERLLAVIILVNKFQKASEKEKKKILKFYLKNLEFVNNGDIVDASADKILGQAILEKIEKKEILEKLAKSKNLGKRRVAIISTFAFIHEEKFSETLKISKMLLEDKEDLIHKAVGGMLREVGKKNEKGVQKCEAFLRQHYKKIPRTTLRYAIEKIPEERRKKILRGEF